MSDGRATPDRMAALWDRLVWWADRKLGTYADKRGRYAAQKVKAERAKRRATRS